MTPTTGTYAANFHEGGRSEILADYLFSAWGTVTPVRRQDDTGVDLYCTLADRIGQRAVVRDYFVVQVKSQIEPWIFDSELSVKWLVEYPSPLFLACVDRKNGILRIYHVTPRFYVWTMGKLPDRLVLVPEVTTEGASIKWTDGNEFSLSAPIIEVTYSDLMDGEKIDKLKAVFRRWVEIDRENCDLVRFGLFRFRMPHSYRVNELPDGGIVEMGLGLVPDTQLLNRGLLTAAESAECIGGQLARLNDLSSALRATLFVRSLTKGYQQALEASPRWRGGRIMGDLFFFVVKRLNEIVSEGGQPKYTYQGIDEVQNALDNLPVVKQFLGKG